MLEQARPALSAEGYEKLRSAIRTLGYVSELLEKKGTTLAALREWFFPASSEKTKQVVLVRAGMETGEKQPDPEHPAPGQRVSPKSRSARADSGAMARPPIAGRRKSSFSI